MCPTAAVQRGGVSVRQRGGGLPQGADGEDPAADLPGHPALPADAHEAGDREEAAGQWPDANNNSSQNKSQDDPAWEPHVHFPRI